MNIEEPVQLYVSPVAADSDALHTLLESVRKAGGRPVEFAEDLPDRYGRATEVGGWLTDLPFELIVVIPLSSLARAVSDAAVAWARERVKNTSGPIEVTIYGPGGFWGPEKLRTIKVKPPKKP
jgi:hypothetical protein